MAQYLVIVARDEPALHELLTQQFAGDPVVRVITDRRRRLRPPAGASREPEWSERDRWLGPGAEPHDRVQWVAVARSREEAIETARGVPNNVAGPEGRERSSGRMEGIEDRQRVDRWIEESQYLIGRVVPGLLDDRERLKGRVEATEQECERLRQEITELRKEISDLQSETQYFRNERAAIAEALGVVLEHVGDIQKPLHEACRRLQVPQAAGLLGSTA